MRATGGASRRDERQGRKAEGIGTTDDHADDHADANIEAGVGVEVEGRPAKSGLGDEGRDRVGERRPDGRGRTKGE